MKRRTPKFALRDLAGAICVLGIAVGLIAAAFITHAGPFILIAVLILLTFGLLRAFRERGREGEDKEVDRALRTRLHKGENLLAMTIGDRRRIKPLATVGDVALMMFTQGLAAEGSGAPGAGSGPRLGPAVDGPARTRHRRPRPDQRDGVHGPARRAELTTRGIP